MIERDSNDFELWHVSCDFCSEEIEKYANHFMRVVEYLHLLNWAIIKDKDEWKHKCPSCRAGTRVSRKTE